MHPTMKLRWKTSHVVKFSIDQKGNLAAIQDKVLQQWWEGSILKKEYRSLKPGTTIPWDGKSVVDMYESHGEWRDIEIAEE